MSPRPYVGWLRHAANPLISLRWERQNSWVPDVTIRLSDTAEAASSKTLEALAQVIRALAPEVSGVSFHDFAADTLWMCEDFLLPEDHQLVEDSLVRRLGGNLGHALWRAGRQGYAVAIPVRDCAGRCQRRGAAEHRFAGQGYAHA